MKWTPEIKQVKFHLTKVFRLVFIQFLSCDKLTCLGFNIWGYKKGMKMFLQTKLSNFSFVKIDINMIVFNRGSFYMIDYFQ